MTAGFFIESMHTSSPNSSTRRCYKRSALPAGSQPNVEAALLPVTVNLEEFFDERGGSLLFGAAPDVDESFERHFGKPLTQIVKEWRSVTPLENQLHVVKCELGQAEIELDRKRKTLMSFRQMSFGQRLKFLFGSSPLDLG